MVGLANILVLVLIKFRLEYRFDKFLVKKVRYMGELFALGFEEVAWAFLTYLNKSSVD